jgi:hypothetical protein
MAAEMKVLQAIGLPMAPLFGLHFPPLLYFVT